MTAMSEVPLIAEKQLLHSTDVSIPNGTAVFLSADSAEPCGVEAFTRKLAAAMAASAPDAAFTLMPVSGRWRELPALVRGIARAKRIVFALPLVAWKRTFVLPLVLLLTALMMRRGIAVFVHEWSALHWIRRLSWMPFIALSDTILILSPFIRDQVVNSPWLSWTAKKCHFIPHPPTVRRPDRLQVTDVVRRVERSAEDCDLVIGHFGALDRGKSPAALLEVC